MMRLLSLFLVLASTASAAPIPFPDTAASWFGYRESIAYLVSRNAITGYLDPSSPLGASSSFKPTATINRAEFLTLVFRGRQGPEPVSGQCFPDVSPDAWYAPFVCAAARRGIVEGYSNPRGGTGAIFRPEQPVNTAEAIKMLVNAYGREVSAAPGAAWYEPYTIELDRTGVLRRSSYIPWSPLTRQRAADMIARTLRFEEDHRLQNLSAGCGKAPDIPPRAVSVNGRERQFLLTIPQNYVAHDPAPLIIAFHGRTNDNARVRSYMGLDREAKDFFVAYPAANSNGKGSFSWGSPEDLAFFDAMVETIAAQYCIDMDRVFTVGHSLGAWYANTVACLRGGVVRGSATVAGDGSTGPCAGPSASLMINNPHDSLSPFGQAERVRDMRLRENGCTAQSEQTDPRELLCRTYKNCDGGNVVTWCPHEIDIDSQGNDYPHQWPRGSARTIVDFFEKL